MQLCGRWDTEFVGVGTEVAFADGVLVYTSVRYSCLWSLQSGMESGLTVRSIGFFDTRIAVVDAKDLWESYLHVKISHP